jgi:hypothetical protein
MSADTARNGICMCTAENVEEVEEIPEFLQQRVTAPPEF